MDIVTVRKRVSIVRETELAFMFRIKSGKRKTYWLPKKFCNICDVYENPMTGLKTYAVDIEKWFWDQATKKQTSLNLK